MSSRSEVNVHKIGWIGNPRLQVGGPTAHWLRPETLVELTNEGRNFTALVDSGSQVNACSGAAVWVPCPPSGRPCGLPGEPHGARWDVY